MNHGLKERTETHACDCISRQAAIDIVEFECGEWSGLARTIAKAIEQLPSAQPERKKDIIQKFHDYQVEWLTNHYDLEFEPTLENLVVRFLHDTANCFMMEMDRGDRLFEGVRYKCHA